MTDVSCRAEKDPPPAYFGPLKGWQTVLVFLVVILVCYHSVLMTTFAVHDDYYALASTLQEPRWPETSVLQGERPIYQILKHAAFLHVDTISELRYVRATGVVGIGLLAFLLHRILTRAHWGYWESLFAATIIATLPSFQVYASSATSFLYPYAALIASSAFLVLEAPRAGPPARRIWLRTASAIAAVFLLLVAMNIHSPSAMFFWVCAAMIIFKPGVSLRAARQRATLSAAVAFAALAVSIMAAGSAGREELVPVGRAWEKLGWFVREPLTNALNYMFLDASGGVAAMTAFLLASGLLLYFAGSDWERLQKLAIAVAIIPLCYLPNLIRAENWSPFRTLPALSSLLVVYALFAITGYRALLQRFCSVVPTAAILCVVAVLGLALAAHNVETYFARPQSRELRLLREKLRSDDLAAAKSIYAVPSQWSDSITTTSYYDEFGYPFSAVEYALKPAIYLALREIRPEKAALSIVMAPAEAAMKVPFHAMTVDMREVRQLRYTPAR